MAWYDSAVFYHIYPLGLCGCPHENTGEAAEHFDKLNVWAEHAQKLGCTAIYIGPLFESGSHGYDTIDYRMVDRRLGTNADFAQFVSHCHKLGMRVIVDGVFNHTGRGFFAFQDIIKNRENSAYCNWYCNVNFGGNTEYNDGFSYDNWGGYNLLAKLNQWNPEVKKYHFDTVRYWVEEFDIDGIRLDAADVLDHAFMHELRQVCDNLKPEFWLMGEVIHGDYSRWANGEMLHSVTNYELHKGLYSGHNDHNYFEIAHTIKRLNGIVGNTRLYTFTDNHDVSRIYSKLNNKQHMYPVALLQYMVPGIPSIYYGSEFGIEGVKENGSDWNLRPDLELADFDENQELPQLFRKLGMIKKQFPEVTYGEYQELLLTNRQFAFARTLDQKAVITAVNNDDQPAHLEIGLPVAANTAKNLLTMQEETQEEKQKKQQEQEQQQQQKCLEKRDWLLEKAGELMGAANQISQTVQDAREALQQVSTQDALQETAQPVVTMLKEQIGNLQRVYNEFCKNSGSQLEDGQQNVPVKACENLEIRDGKLIVDLAPNRGVIAYVTNE